MAVWTVALNVDCLDRVFAGSLGPKETIGASQRRWMALAVAVVASTAATAVIATSRSGRAMPPPNRFTRPLRR
ncbi:MAG TPA: hypothetical protein VFE60_07985 [Roseiarcus sp.]|nr:hypothetical protein [Roseiarcus sp.]